jgi:hypothetical protein
MNRSSRKAPYARSATKSWTLNAIMRSLPARHLYAASIDITAWCRLCTAPSPVLHLSIHAARHGLSSRGAPTAFQTCSPLFTAWTLNILISLATPSTSWSATQCNLSLVRKGLTSPGPGATGPEERKRKEFIKKVERGAAVAPGWTPDFSFHPMGLDLNGAWGPSALRIVDFTSRLASLRTTEPQARICRRSIQAVSRNISEWNATLIRARRPQPFPNTFERGP